MKFQWSNFDQEFIVHVVYSGQTKKENRPAKKTDDKDMLIPSMDKISPYPTKEFVDKYRTEIEKHVLRKHPEYIERIYRNQSSSKRKPKPTNYLGMLADLSSRPLTATLLTEYINALGTIGSGANLFEGMSMFAQPLTINLETSIANDIDLYDFQEKAIARLHEDFLTRDKANGLLVMPTGSGKTRTAVYFLLRDMVSQGYQVIWLTHRHQLIDQTADAFYRLAPVIKLGNKSAKSFKMACISGVHSTIKATEKDDDVMIISIQSVVRSLDYLKSVIGKKVMIVVDEAHHTVAPSYRKTINYIRKRKPQAKLLGLTATPIRANDFESKYLLQLYDNHFAFEIPMSKLITKKILADPHFETIETEYEVEPTISIDEAQLIKKFGEIPASLADKIARSTKRNQVIIDTYMKNRERYGKTLIFALNVYHCYTLCDELSKKGVRCDYVYAGNSDNQAKITRFKENELDVLININILTEGSDVPDIQTIFLTRPTQSEGLLMQMIGRGMRGSKAKGTETTIIVDFCDKWDTFNKWLNPQWLIGIVDPPVDDEKEYKHVEKILIPWELIKDIYYNITYAGDRVASITKTLPVGWYAVVDEDGENYSILVFEDQLKGYDNMRKDETEILTDRNMGAPEILKQYFNDFGMPPHQQDIEILLKNWRQTGELPTMFRLEERDDIDPARLAQTLKERNVGLADLDGEARTVFEAHSNIIESIFGDYETYFDRILDSIKYQKLRQESIIEEIPVELIPFRMEPIYDLHELTQEVVVEMFDGQYSGLESIEWTDKPYSSYYGLYHPGGRIKINSLLNSPDVERETVKFVIYHELLHRDHWRHDKAFYAKEHEYPNYTEHNRFLDYKRGNYKFDW